MLSREETLEREPLLREKGLKGSGLYVSTVPMMPASPWK